MQCNLLILDGTLKESLEHEHSIKNLALETQKKIIDIYVQIDSPPIKIISHISEVLKGENNAIIIK